MSARPSRVSRFAADMAAVERHFRGRMQRVAQYKAFAHLEPTMRRADLTMAVYEAHSDALRLGVLHGIDQGARLSGEHVAQHDRTDVGKSPAFVAPLV